MKCLFIPFYSVFLLERGGRGLYLLCMKKLLLFPLILAIALSTSINAFAAKKTARKVAVQTYTFSQLPLDELIPVLKEVGADCIGASGGLKLSKKYPDVRFNPSMTDEQKAYAHKLLKDAKIKVVSYGVVGSKTREDVENLCKFAKEFDCPVIITEDKPEQFKFWDEIAPQYGVKMALHNHAYNNYKSNAYFYPRLVEMLIRPYKNVYACADNGHWIRSGLDTIEGHNILKGKLQAIHFKDMNKAELNAHCVPFGKGVANMKEVLKNLDEQGYDGYFVIEYEGTRHPVKEVKQCIEFLRNN